MKCVVLMLVISGLLASASAAQEAPSFKDKQINMIIGFTPGGGTDVAGRVIARFLSKYLPGQPTIVVRNQPGADGITALNYMVQQTKPDGSFIAMGSSSQVDPLNYRSGKAAYDPSKFAYVGGVGRGRSILIINAQAEKRLYDSGAPPVMMGSVGVPRSSMQMAAWGIAYLGWNARWIVGYSGSNDVLLALNRGEIDMASVDLAAASRLTVDGKYKALTQGGNLDAPGPVPSGIERAPIFKQQMQGKLPDPIARQAFDYWLSLNSADKWLGLMPGTPSPIVEAYRDAFRKLSVDPEFLDTSGYADEDFTPISPSTLERIVKTLAMTSPEAINHMSSLLRKQGVSVAN